MIPFISLMKENKFQERDLQIVTQLPIKHKSMDFHVKFI